MVQRPKDILATQSPSWSEGELLRVARFFELLIKIDKRLTKGRLNEKAPTTTDKTKHRH
jgi:hypothetical protein